MKLIGKAVDSFINGDRFNFMIKIRVLWIKKIKMMSCWLKLVIVFYLVKWDLKLSDSVCRHDSWKIKSSTWIGQKKRIDHCGFFFGQYPDPNDDKDLGPPKK